MTDHRLFQHTYLMHKLHNTYSQDSIPKSTIKVNETDKVLKTFMPESVEWVSIRYKFGGFGVSYYISSKTFLALLSIGHSWRAWSEDNWSGLRRQVGSEWPDRVASLAIVASLQAIRRKGEIASLGMLTNCPSVSILRMKWQFAAGEFSGDWHKSVAFNGWFD